MVRILDASWAYFDVTASAESQAPGVSQLRCTLCPLRGERKVRPMYFPRPAYFLSPEVPLTDLTDVTLVSDDI